jgi:hypothetical protein
MEQPTIKPQKTVIEEIIKITVSSDSTSERIDRYLANQILKMQIPSNFSIPTSASGIQKMILDGFVKVNR